MRTLNVLVACECSGVVRQAFRALGHNAWSCDLKPAEDGSEYHIQGDALRVIGKGCPELVLIQGKQEASCSMGFKPWDLIIMHPPCTRMALSGALRMYHGGKKANGLDPVKVAEQEAALQFVRDLIAAAGNTPYCIENPASVISTRIRKFDQEIQPYQFGHDASKKTWLWLNHLPKLVPHDPGMHVYPRLVCSGCLRTNALSSALAFECECGKENAKYLPRWANQTNSGQNRLAPSERRATDRARTYQGIAKAMAEQWSAYLSTDAAQARIAGDYEALA